MSKGKPKPGAVKSKKKLPLLFTIGTAAFLIGGGTAAYWVLTQGNLTRTNLPVGTNIVPQNALLTVSLSTTGDQWTQLRQFGTPESQAQLDRVLVQFRDRFLTANGLNYQQDIQPWVGDEVTLALLPSPTGAVVPQQALPVPANTQSVIAILPIRDPLKAKELLGKARPANAGRMTTRIYKGVEIQESSGTAPFSAAALDARYLVVTNSPKATEQAIDAYKGDPALNATPGFSQAMGQIQSPQPFARVYVNIPAASAMAAAGNPQATQDPNQQSQGLAATVSLQPEGIQFKSISWLKPNSERKFQVRNTARRMPELLPGDTLIMASGGNLRQLWLDYTQGVAANYRNFDPRELQQGIASTTGMDLERDFLPWMQGEFSLSLIPAPQNAPPSLPLGLMLMVESTDRRAADNALGRLDEVMAGKYKFKVGQAKVGNETVTTWTNGELTVTRGWLPNDVAFLTLGAPVASKVLPKPASPLAQNDLFRQSTASGLQPNNGHFFVDVDRAINANPFPLVPLPAGSQPFVKSIQSIGITAAISGERSSRHDIFVKIRQGQAPKPLPSPGASPVLPPGASPSPAPEASPSP